MNMKKAILGAGILAGGAIAYVGIDEVFNKFELKRLEKKYGIIKNDDGSYRVTKTTSIEETLDVIRRHGELTGKGVKELRAFDPD